MTVGPDLTLGGLQDAFVLKILADGTGLAYAGYIGGDGVETGYGIALDAAGNAYVTGQTSSPVAFPVSIGPDLTFNGDRDAFVAKVRANGLTLDYAGFIGGAAEDAGRVKQLADPDNINLSWIADPVANGYNVWWVSQKTDIDRARQASQPPATGVVACSAPTPAPTNVCTDLAAVPRGAPSILFYQVRSDCDANIEGP